MENGAWDWSRRTGEAVWREVPDEFLVVAERWRAEGYSRAIDVGCGPGRFALHLARLGMEVSAIDLSISGLKQIDERADRASIDIETRQADMHNMPYADGSFDCAVAFNSIYHTDSSGLRTVMAELRRIVRGGGSIYCTLLSTLHDSYASQTEWLDSATAVRTGGPEKGIPHTFCSDDMVADLIGGFDAEFVRLQSDLSPGRRMGFHYHIHVRVPID